MLIEADEANDDGYFGETEEIAADTGLSLRVVKEYQEYASDLRWAKHAIKHNIKEEENEVMAVIEKETPLQQLNRLMSG